MKKLLLICLLSLVIVPAASARKLPMPSIVQNQFLAWMDQKILAPSQLYLISCKSPSINVYNCVIVDGSKTAHGGVGLQRISQCAYKLYLFNTDTNKSLTRKYNLCNYNLYINFP